MDEGPKIRATGTVTHVKCPTSGTWHELREGTENRGFTCLAAELCGRGRAELQDTG